MVAAQGKGNPHVTCLVPSVRSGGEQCAVGGQRPPGLDVPLVAGAVPPLSTVKASGVRPFESVRILPSLVSGDTDLGAGRGLVPPTEGPGSSAGRWSRPTSPAAAPVAAVSGRQPASS